MFLCSGWIIKGVCTSAGDSCWIILIFAPFTAARFDSSSPFRLLHSAELDLFKLFKASVWFIALKDSTGHVRSPINKWIPSAQGESWVYTKILLLLNFGSLKHWTKVPGLGNTEFHFWIWEVGCRICKLLNVSHRRVLQQQLLLTIQLHFNDLWNRETIIAANFYSLYCSSVKRFSLLSHQIPWCYKEAKMGKVLLTRGEFNSELVQDSLSVDPCSDILSPWVLLKPSSDLWEFTTNGWGSRRFIG